MYKGICNSNPHAPGIISKLYTHLTTTSSHLSSYTTCWINDLNVSLEQEDWDDIWATTNSSSQNITAVETNYKVLLRWYMVSARIAKYLPTYPPTCFRGCGEQGTYVHIWWTCPVVQRFWVEIFKILSTLLKRLATPDPAFALLNHCPPDLTKAQSKLAIYIITASKHRVRAWKPPSLCSLETKNRVTQAMIHSKIESTLLDRIPRHLKIWQPWVDHFLPPQFDPKLLEP